MITVSFILPLCVNYKFPYIVYGLANMQKGFIAVRRVRLNIMTAFENIDVRYSRAFYTWKNIT